MSISFGPDQWATLEIMARDLLSGKVPITDGKTMNVGDQQLNAVVRAFETTEGTVAIVFLSSFMSKPTIDLLRGKFPLTQKEAEVTLLLCDGHSNKEVARRMKFKVSTAEKHAENVLSKLGIGSRKDVLEAITRRAG